MATREEVERTLCAYEPGPDDPSLADIMRGPLDAAGAGVEPAGPAVTFHAADPTGPDGDVVLPSAILSDGGGVILPAGEIGLFAGSGGSGKSRLSLQVAVAAAGVPAGTAEPIPDGTLRVASGPVVMLGYEDAAPWIAWRARRLARWLDDRAGTTHHARAVTDPERLSVAAVDAPLFGVMLGAGREAIPGPLASWRPLWDHAAAIGARLVIIDPVALAGQWDGYSALPVGAFIAAIRHELRALTDPCGALLVCHTTKAARFGVQDADRTGAEAIVGSGAWVDRARAALMLDAIQNGDGRKRLSVAKANYAAQRILCDVQSVNDGTGHPLAFAVATADASAGGTMTNIRSGGNTDPVAVGNRAADAWAKADPRAVVITAASDDGQAALGRAADAFTDAGWNDKARPVADVAMLARVVAQMGALAGRVAQQSPTLAEEMRRGLELEGLSIPAVVEMLQTTPAGGGWTALAVLHARQPQTVAPDVTRHPHAGILPASLAGAAVRVQVSDRFDERLPELPGPGVAADGDGWLPGFDPRPGPLAKLPALDFLHAGGLEAFQRGRGAPWPLRIAYETLIDVPAAARNGGIARLEYPLRGDGDATLQAMLYPEGRLNLSRDWRRFLAALEVVDRFSVPADGGMSAWLPIRVRSVPVRTGGVLRLDVSLPPGSDKGPRILRRVLRRLGARSYPQWRAWLALAYLWDRSAVNGHWVRATRPRLARDSGGRLVDATGAVMLDKRGAPVTKWKDRRAVLLDTDDRPVPTAGEAAREHNPDARLHPWLTEADIVALGYPPERGLSASGVRSRKARVLEDLAVFEAEGLIVFEAHPDRRLWRVLPPDTDPA